MIAIPVLEIVKGLESLKDKGVPEEDCVLLVSQNKDDQKYYIMEKKDLWK